METEKETILDSKIEDIGPCKKRVTINIPGDQVTDEIDKQYADIIANYQFRGFRKGKVPRRLVEKQLGENVLAEVRQTLVIESFEKAVENHEVTPIGDPEMDVDELELAAGVPLEFDITFEVKPTFELPDLASIEVDREVEPIDEEQVGKTLDHLARSRGTYEDIDDPGEIRPDDLVYGETSLCQDEETILEHEDFRFIPGEKRVYGLPVDSLPDRLADAEFGKQLEIEIEIPEYVAGQGRLKEGRAMVRITPSRVQRLAIPEIDDEFAKALDFEALDDLKADIRKQSEVEAGRVADRRVEDGILDAIVEKTPFDVPEGIVDRQLDQFVERERIRMQVEGVPELEIEEKIDLSRNKQKDEVVMGMKKAFILEAIAKAEKIFVTEDMVEATLSVLASQQGRGVDELRDEFEASGRVRELRTELRERMTRESLRKKAKVTDKNAEPKD